MSQLKFVRSKSTTRLNPLGRLKQQLKQVQKPGKLHVSVGRSRQSSQANEELPISTPKQKMNLKLPHLHQINENTVQLQESIGWQSLLPLSHDTRITNDSKKPLNQTQYNENWGNIYKQQHYYTQTNYCSPKLSESEKIDKLDTFQVKSTKLNSSDHQSFSVCDVNTTSKFNFNQITLKQSQLINQQQQQNPNIEQYRLYNSTNSNTNTKLKNEMQEQIQNSQKNQKFESIILDIYPTFTKKNQVKTQPIIEQNEDEEFQGMKCSTQSSSQRQIPKFYSQILTDRSFVLNAPKKFHETEIQTSFTQTPQIETVQPSKLNLSCKSTTNASVQTKSKQKNLGLFQYQLSYLSPKANRNFLETDLLSLDDFQSQIIYESQQGDENKIKNQMLKEIDLNNRSQVLSQKSNIYMAKQLLLDPEDDSQPFYLQAEPKEINSNLFDKKSINKKSISKDFTHNSCTSLSKGKIEKSTSFQSVNCYKDHLNILINQSCQNNNKVVQNEPYIVQDNKINKQKYPLRTSQSNQNIKKSQRSKQTRKY